MRIGISFLIISLLAITVTIAPSYASANVALIKSSMFSSYYNSSFNVPFITTKNNTALIKGNVSNLRNAASENGWCVYASWQELLHGTKNSEVFTVASNDGGQTYGKPINLSNNTGLSINPIPAAWGDEFYVAWQDNTPGNNDIFFMKSDNCGNSFGPVINVSNSPTESILGDLKVINGKVLIVYTEKNATSGDIPHGYCGSRC